MNIYDHRKSLGRRRCRHRLENVQPVCLVLIRSIGDIKRHRNVIRKSKPIVPVCILPVKILALPVKHIFDKLSHKINPLSFVLLLLSYRIIEADSMSIFIFYRYDIIAKILLT